MEAMPRNQPGENDLMTSRAAIKTQRRSWPQEMSLPTQTHLKAGRAGSMPPPVLQSREKAATAPPSESGGRAATVSASPHAPVTTKQLLVDRLSGLTSNLATDACLEPTVGRGVVVVCIVSTIDAAARCVLNVAVLLGKPSRMHLFGGTPVSCACCCRPPPAAAAAKASARLPCSGASAMSASAAAEACLHTCRADAA